VTFRSNDSTCRPTPHVRDSPTSNMGVLMRSINPNGSACVLVLACIVNCAFRAYLTVLQWARTHGLQSTRVRISTMAFSVSKTQSPLLAVRNPRPVEECPVCPCRYGTTLRSQADRWGGCLRPAAILFLLNQCPNESHSIFNSNKQYMP
jgi:hypothetical protein